MPVRLTDLPPEARKRVKARGKVIASDQPGPPPSPPAGRTVGLALRCCACGEVLPGATEHATTAAMDRHAGERHDNGALRFECVP
jgi:hypothetical protein